MWPFGPSRKALEARVIQLEESLRQQKNSNESLRRELSRAGTRNRDLESQLQAALRKYRPVAESTARVIPPDAGLRNVQQSPRARLVHPRDQPATTPVIKQTPEPRIATPEANPVYQNSCAAKLTQPGGPRIATPEAIQTQVLPIIDHTSPAPACEPASSHSSSSHCASNSCGSSNSCGGPFSFN